MERLERREERGIFNKEKYINDAHQPALCWNLAMTPIWFRDPMVLGSAGAAVAILGGVGLYFALRKKETAEEIEHRRRSQLVEMGRIVDATLLDLTDADGSHGQQRHLFYQYEIAGVSYECSQDVTLLPEQLRGTASTPGMPASARYDPRNPFNSIVVAEEWTGLRHSKSGAD